MEMSPRDTLRMLEEQRDQAVRKMVFGIERMMDAHVDGEDILPGLEEARQGALAFEQFVMGKGPMPTCLFRPVKQAE